MLNTRLPWLRRAVQERNVINTVRRYVSYQYTLR